MTNKQWTAIGVIVTIVIGVLALYLQKPATSHAPQSMNNSPGGIQVQGDNNVIDPKAELYLDYKLNKSIKLAEGAYSNEFTLVYYSQDSINEPHLPLKIKKDLNCQSPVRTKQTTVMGGKHDGMHEILYNIICISSEQILSESGDVLFKLQ